MMMCDSVGKKEVMISHIAGKLETIKMWDCVGKQEVILSDFGKFCMISNDMR